MGVSLVTCDARRMLLRRERADDVDVIHQIHLEAFGALGIYGDAPPVEAQLVRDLRADDGWVPALSIVAETAEGAVVGHVVATEGHLEGARVVGLGPLGVLPDQQKAGVGSALMHAVLGAADALDYDLVALLGDPGYYRRFGFVPAASLGIDAPDPAWGDHFQVRALSAYRGTTGGFRYAAPFERL